MAVIYGMRDMIIEFIVYAGIALAIVVGIAAEISGRRKRKQKNATGKL